LGECRSGLGLDGASGVSQAGFMSLFFVFIPIALLLASVFWIWMLVDCVRNPALPDVQKILWALIIFFLHLIGALLYFFLARGNRGAAA
jgi:Phospholipase_D-nuclease N-terminal